MFKSPWLPSGLRGLLAGATQLITNHEVRVCAKHADARHAKSAESQLRMAFAVGAARKLKIAPVRNNGN